MLNLRRYRLTMTRSENKQTISMIFPGGDMTAQFIKFVAERANVREEYRWHGALELRVRERTRAPPRFPRFRPIRVCLFNAILVINTYQYS